MEPEHKVAAALRAQAAAKVSAPPAPPVSIAPPPGPTFSVAWMLVLALLTGALLGASLALISIFEPGLLLPMGSG
jgi:hypothetical protein